MREIDKRTIIDYGVSSLELMENAGKGVAEALKNKFDDLLTKKILVFCGKGNNGGDGLVIARLLFLMGVDVKVLLFEKKDSLKKDVAINADLAYRLGVNIIEVRKANDHIWDYYLKSCDIIIDALFGTGLTRQVSGIYEQAIEKINQAGKFVTAVDIPSGVGSDSGQLVGPHVRADMTVALALLKRSHVLYPAAEVMGELETVDIKIPPDAVDSQLIKVQATEEIDLRSWLPKRSADTHKGTYGHLLVIAGSKGKSGAAGLTALAALRAGCGLVTLAIPESCHQALEFYPLEVMTVSAFETSSGTFALSSKEALLNYCVGKSAVAVGPGISTEPETVQLLSELLPSINCPLVIDADGVNCLANYPNLVSKLGSSTVLTPHPKEFSRVSGIEISKILANKIEIVTKYASKNSVNIVLKGAASIIAQPNGLTTINPTGNPGMATAGSGDVLTGVIASLIAQGLSSAKAAVTGVYLHGLAGDIFAQAESETSLIAGDLLRTLPESIKRILN